MFDTWDKGIKNEFSRTEKQALIHPSGFDEIQYFNSGKYDSLQVINKCNLKKEDLILEYGCGDGRIMRHLNDNYNIYGVDIVEDFILHSHKLNLKTSLLENNKINNFDKIYSLTVFIHLNKSNSKNALQYIYDNLKDGGLAYLQILVYGFDHDANEYIALNYWKKETLEKMVKSIGFKINHIEEMKGNINEGKFADNHNNFCIFEK